MVEAFESNADDPQPGLDDFTVDELETVPFSDVMVAVDQLDQADPDWVDLQWHVADGLHDRYLDSGEVDDLNEAIRRGRLVVAAQREQSPGHLHDLALMMWDRIEQSHRSDDLQEYLRLLAAALALVQGDGDADLRAKCQANLATGLVSQGRYQSAVPDIERATLLWEADLASGRLDHGAQAGIAANIAQALSWDGASEDDLRRAVDYGRRSVQDAESEPETMAHHEFALAAALGSLHSMIEDDGLLDEAIAQTRRGLDHLGPDHLDTPGYTANLIGLLRQQSRELGEVEPLDEAVRLARGIVNQTRDTDLDRALILSTAAAAISEAATQTDDKALLLEAVELYRHAIAVAPESSPEQAIALLNLASVCRDANERLDAPDLIDEGIHAGTRALGIFDAPGLHRAAALTATSNCLRDRFVVAGEAADLDRALGYAEEAVTLTPERHPERAARLTNLAVVLSDDFAERADRAHLDRAITLYREALEASERVGVRVPERLNDLALALRDRQKDAGNTDDLHEAVTLAEGALAASRPGRLVWAGYANNLGNALAERYELDGDPDDLDRVIGLFQQALADAQGRGLESSGYATNLGLALATKARVTGALTDMDQALLSLARSIDLLPPGHPDRAWRGSNLADGYRQRSIMLENTGHTELAQADANTAVDTAEDAVAIAGSNDARLLPALSNLADALRWRRDLIEESGSGSRIVEVQRRAATLDRITPAEKFGQAGRWARDAEHIGERREAMSAYAHAVAQTTEVAWIGLSARERLGLLAEMNDVLSRAVACAVVEEPWTAVAWADHVRSVLWRQGLQATALSALRNDLGLVRLSGLQNDLHPETPALQRHQREQLRQWAHAERDALRGPMRRPELYKTLEFPGVVVLLVPGDDASFALLLRVREEPQLVPLPDAPRVEVIAHVNELRRASASFELNDQADPASELRSRHAIFDCLAWLWRAVAAPILNEIAPPTDERPQVWWSPIGEFALLPIHAAGLHPRKSGQITTKSRTGIAATVPDQSRSSYLPTIMDPRPRLAPTATTRAHLLYVSANDAAQSLRHLATEHETVRSTLDRIPIEELIDEQATISAVRDAIPSCSF